MSILVPQGNEEFGDLLSNLKSLLLYCLYCKQESSQQSKQVLTHPDVDILEIHGELPAFLGENTVKHYLSAESSHDLWLMIGLQKNSGKSQEYQPWRRVNLNTMARGNHQFMRDDAKAVAWPENRLKPKQLPANESSLNRWLKKQINEGPDHHTLELYLVALVPKSWVGDEKAFDQYVAQIASHHKAPQSLLQRVYLNKAYHPKLSADAHPSWLLPVGLTQSQRDILLDQTPLQLVKGAPGTGKTHTMAAKAVHAMAQGQSVLIACRTDHALEVVENKLVDEFGVDPRFLLNFGHGKKTGRFKSQLKRLLKPNVTGEDFVGQLAVNAEAYSKRYQQLMNALAKHPELSEGQLAKSILEILHNLYLS